LFISAFWTVSIIDKLDEPGVAKPACETCPLAAFEIRTGRDQRRTTTGFMAVIGNLNTVDSVMQRPFDDCSNTVYGAGDLVAYAGNIYAANGKMSCSDISDSATVGCGIAQADDVRHARSRAELVRNHIRPTSTRLLPGISDAHL